MLKDHNNCKELPFDAMVLSFYFMQNNFTNEFDRASSKMGVYHLKEQFAEMKLMLTGSSISNFKPLEDIINTVKSSCDVACKVERIETYRMSQSALARLCIENGCVGISSQTGSITVRSVTSSYVYAVTLFPLSVQMFVSEHW